MNSAVHYEDCKGGVSPKCYGIQLNAFLLIKKERNEMFFLFGFLLIPILFLVSSYIRIWFLLNLEKQKPEDLMYGQFIFC